MGDRPPGDAIPVHVGAGDFTYRGQVVPRFVAGEGSRLRDSEGREYVDAEAANGSVSLGYDSSILEQAAAAVSSMPALPSFCESDLRVRVAQRLGDEISRAVGSPGRISFEVGGAQGIELAMKIVAANRRWGTVATLQGSYHGRSPFAGSLSSSSRYRRPIQVASAEVVRLPYPATCGSGGVSEEACLAYLRSLKSDQSGLPESVSAFLFEPVLNVGGMARPQSNYLQAAATQLRERGALIVIDEIFTGFHRVGPRFGFELHDLDPDIVVLSKALTNGVAGLSAVWAREPLLDPDHFPPGTHSSTFSGTPLMLAVAETVLDRYADRAVWRSRIAELERQLRQLVSEVAEVAPDVIESSEAFGGVARLRLRKPVAWEIRNAALRPGDDPGSKGLLVASTGMAPDVVSLHPPLTISGEDLGLVRDTLIRAVRSTA